MEVSNNPIPSKELPDGDRAFQEWKVLAEESRFVMTRYMQGLLAYLALVGFAVREMLSAPSAKVATVIFVFVSILNAVGKYAADNFRSMAYPSLNRQALLADYLKMQRPHPMLYGYYVGLALVIITQISLIVMLVIKL